MENQQIFASSESKTPHFPSVTFKPQQNSSAPFSQRVTQLLQGATLHNATSFPLVSEVPAQNNQKQSTESIAYSRQTFSFLLKCSFGDNFSSGNTNESVKKFLEEYIRTFWHDGAVEHFFDDSNDSLKSGRKPKPQH